MGRPRTLTDEQRKLNKKLYIAKWNKENREKRTAQKMRGRRRKGVMPKVILTPEQRKINKAIENKKRKKTIIGGLNEWIAQIKCADCGLNFEQYPWLAMFHHETERVGDSKGLRCYASGIKRLFIELNKGVFLCPNCHVTLHYLEDAVCDSYL